MFNVRFGPILINTSNEHPLKACCRSPLTKLLLAGRVLGNMFFQRTAPQGLKGVTTAIQCIHFGKIRMLTAQIAPFDTMGGYAGVILFFNFCLSHNLHSFLGD